MANQNSLGEETLLLIPCCARKAPDDSHQSLIDPLTDIVSEVSYSLMIQKRAMLLDQLQRSNKYTSGTKARNIGIREGADFGKGDFSGGYLPAIERYIGNLYTAHHEVVDAVKELANNKGQPRLLILSALYGPLHPLSPIQNYNLQMSDSLATTTWRTGFAEFLGSYVESLGIRDIHLFVGSSTPYFWTAMTAAKPIRGNKKLDHIYQYHIVEGNSYHTPHNHGLLLLKMLTGRSDLKFTRLVENNCE